MDFASSTASLDISTIRCWSALRTHKHDTNKSGTYLYIDCTTSGPKLQSCTFSVTQIICKFYLDTMQFKTQSINNFFVNKKFISNLFFPSDTIFLFVFWYTKYIKVILFSFFLIQDSLSGILISHTAFSSQQVRVMTGSNIRPKLGWYMLCLCPGTSCHCEHMGGDTEIHWLLTSNLSPLATNRATWHWTGI